MAQMAPDTLRILVPYQEEGEISFSTIPERLDNLDAYTNWGGSERGSKEDILSELQKEMGLEQSEGVEQQMGGMQIRRRENGWHFRMGAPAVCPAL